MTNPKSGLMKGAALGLALSLAACSSVPDKDNRQEAEQRNPLPPGFSPPFIPGGAKESSTPATPEEPQEEEEKKKKKSVQPSYSPTAAPPASEPL